MKGTFPVAVLWVAIARHFTFGQQTNFVSWKTLVGFSHWSCRIRSTPAKCKAIREQHISFVTDSQASKLPVNISNARPKAVSGAGRGEPASAS